MGILISIRHTLYHDITAKSIGYGQIIEIFFDFLTSVCKTRMVNLPLFSQRQGAAQSYGQSVPGRRREYNNPVPEIHISQTRRSYKWIKEKTFSNARTAAGKRDTQKDASCPARSNTASVTAKPIGKRRKRSRNARRRSSPECRCRQQALAADLRSIAMSGCACASRRSRRQLISNMKRHWKSISSPGWAAASHWGSRQGSSTILQGSFCLRRSWLRKPYTIFLLC